MGYGSLSARQPNDAHLVYIRFRSNHSLKSLSVLATPGWTLLTTCESYKPSGLPAGQISNEDKEYASAGEEFIFPTDAPAVRYIRFKALSTFTGVKFIHLMEVTFYGKPVETK